MRRRFTKYPINAGLSSSDILKLDSLNKFNSSSTNRPTYRCPQCTNYTLVDIDSPVTRAMDIGYHDRFVCEECGAEFLAEPFYSGDIRFVDIDSDF